MRLHWENRADLIPHRYDEIYMHQAFEVSVADLVAWLGNGKCQKVSLLYAS